MADGSVVKISLLLFLLNITLLAYGQQRDFLSIIDPKPKNMFVIEDLDPPDVASTTCRGKDLNITRQKKPEGMSFHRVIMTGDANETALQSNNVFNFSVSYEDNRTTVVGTMQVRNVRMSHNGQYQCWVLPHAKDYTIARHGFTLTVIPKSEVPVIAVNGGNVDKTFGDIVTLQCNLTKKGESYTKLTRMEWIKDGEVIKKSLHPNDENLKPLNFTINKPEDVGMFTCRLTSLLRSVRTYNLTKTIRVTVKAKSFARDMEDNEIIRKKGETVRMKCEARGNPITVEWQRKDSSGNRTAITNRRYNTTSRTPYDGFELVIKAAEYADRGDYWCCIKNDTTGAVSDCQKFTLRVKDPLGYLWPLVGIIVEVIVLVIIIVLYEVFKKNKDDDFDKTDGHSEFSYTTSDDGDKGTVRLRRSAGDPQ